MFWENYKCAFEWNNGSRVAHWKARAKALEAENAILRDFIQREFQSRPRNSAPLPFVSCENSYRNKEEVFPNFEEATENETVYSEPQIDEELLAFYEKTFRHKIERKKQRSMEEKCSNGESQSESEEVYSMGPVSIAQKSKDMAVLYGKDASKIFSMELSMQINFDMNCRKSNAQLWPNIPLRLS